MHLPPFALHTFQRVAMRNTAASIETAALDISATNTTRRFARASMPAADVFAQGSCLLEIRDEQKAIGGGKDYEKCTLSKTRWFVGTVACAHPAGDSERGRPEP